jgi:hypothetical protein
MAKKMKLNLEDIKIQSFVTSLSKNQKEKVMGGDTFACTPRCNTEYYICKTVPATGDPCVECK